MNNHLKLTSISLPIKYVVVMLCILASLKLNAQDLHFSQYFANPISYNPANTGLFNGSYRLGLNHKQQWPWAIEGKFLNYNTSSVYADFSMFDKKINKLDWMGLGFNFFNDQAGDGNLTANKAYMSMAYHKGLDKNHKHFLSLGFTLGYVHRTINFGALYFNNQWVDRVGFDLTLPNGESYTKENTSYLDFGIGIQGKHQLSDKINYTYGFSMLHLNKAQETFYNQDNRLGIRSLIQTALEYKINERVNIEASMYYTHQKKAHEFLLGGLASYNVVKNLNDKPVKLYLGSFYRLNDALSPIFGVQYNKTRLLMNYDVNLSSLSQASNGRGGFELSLIQIGTTKKKRNPTTKTYCPSF